jgi:DDE superfamily endonuclease
VSYCPHSSLPDDVLAWLAVSPVLSHPPRPPGRGGTPPLALEVRLDAVGAVPARRPGGRDLQDRGRRQHGPAVTQAGSPRLLPARRHVHHHPGRPGWPSRRDGLVRGGGVRGRLATRVQRPSGWSNQKVLYDAKRHAHTAQGLALFTVHGDLLWCDGGWPGSCHEQELVALSGVGQCAGRSRCRHFAGPWVSRPRQAARALACASRGSQDKRPAHRRAAGVQPRAGEAAGASGAVDRPSGRRVGAAPLARAAVPRPGRLPGRWRAGVPGPLAPPGPQLPGVERVQQVDQRGLAVEDLERPGAGGDGFGGRVALLRVGAVSELHRAPGAFAYRPKSTVTKGSAAHFPPPSSSRVDEPRHACCGRSGWLAAGCGVLGAGVGEPVGNGCPCPQFGRPDGSPRTTPPWSSAPPAPPQRRPERDDHPTTPGWGQNSLEPDPSVSGWGHNALLGGVTTH